ncbi:MAG: hypothetical protein M3O03_15335 [Pseudomonadota bacterium]|nr:hypothetical protein [Pseudomonadota bacterium]
MEQNNPPQVLVLDAEADTTYEKGAKLLSFVAYPKAEEAGKREVFRNALCHWALKHDCETHPEDNAPITIKPAYFGFDRVQVDRHINFLDKELGKRLIAGRMAVAYLKWFKGGRIPAEFGNIHSLSLDKIVEFIFRSEGYGTPDNFETRIWRPSRPVIHFAAALMVVGQDIKRSGKELHAMHLLADNEVLTSVITNAINFAQTIRENPGFPAAPEQLVGLQII